MPILPKIVMVFVRAAQQVVNNVIHLINALNAHPDISSPPIMHVRHVTQDAFNVLLILTMDTFVQIVQPNIILTMETARHVKLHVNNVAHKLFVYHASILTFLKLVLILA